MTFFEHRSTKLQSKMNYHSTKSIYFSYRHQTTDIPRFMPLSPRHVKIFSGFLSFSRKNSKTLHNIILNINDNNTHFRIIKFYLNAI